jgi:hypothetical protein
MWKKRTMIQSAEAWTQRTLSWNLTWTKMTIWKEEANGSLVADFLLEFRGALE